MLILTTFVRHKTTEPFRIDALLMPHPTESTRPLNLVVGILVAGYGIYSLSAGWKDQPHLIDLCCQSGLLPKGKKSQTVLLPERTSSFSSPDVYFRRMGTISVQAYPRNISYQILLGRSVTRCPASASPKTCGLGCSASGEIDATICVAVPGSRARKGFSRAGWLQCG